MCVCVCIVCVCVCVISAESFVFPFCRCVSSPLIFVPYLQVDGMTPLMLAVKANHMHVAAALIEHGASIVVGKVCRCEPCLVVYLTPTQFIPCYLFI